jgi:hypothetical protein
MRKLAILTACVACSSGDRVASTSAPLLWLTGFTVTAASDATTPAASSRLAELGGTNDDGDNYGAMSIAAGDGSVLASYRRGVIVVDRTGRVSARAPGFEPTGSADDVVALASGDAMIGAPVIVLALSSGGHRESTTSIVIYRAGTSARLDRLFVGAVEEREGTDTWPGTIVLFPNGLLYRAPRTDVLTVWIFDAQRGRYIERARLPPPRHEERPQPWPDPSLASL